MSKIDCAGFVNFYKPTGITSNTALAKFRKITLVKKSGYAGTLDPFACGVLPIACGKSTKEINLLTDAIKQYEVIVQFGTATDTGDCEGKIINQSSNFQPNPTTIERAIKDSFIGKIMQSPPVYSATKHHGKRMCDIARSGTMDVTSMQDIMHSKNKEIEIFEFAIKQHNANNYCFTITCSKGTYIRQLITDLAQYMGGLAHCTALKRTKVGLFIVEESATLDQLENTEDWQFFLQQINNN